MRTNIFVLLFACFICSILSCSDNTDNKTTAEATSKKSSSATLSLEEAERLARLPMKCIQNNLPYKAGLTIEKEADLQLPIVHHPAFYGCFDWHSAVHGHWSLVYLLKRFPDLSIQEEARKKLSENLTAGNIQKEIDYFSLNKYTKSFERTYGWAWLLKLGEELKTWDDPEAQQWYKNLEPLCRLLSEKYIDYLPKLVYPIRVGEHSNTAFGLSFALDYARSVGDIALEDLIVSRAKSFYVNDNDCPITWEPSGYDFLSPCLEEMNLMRRVLNKNEFLDWSQAFLPKLLAGKEGLETGKIKDRSDGKLVHLDGLNFSRAWCLFPLGSSNAHIQNIAEEHLAYSLAKITDGDYAGEHWLASFALYALKTRDEN